MMMKELLKELKDAWGFEFSELDDIRRNLKNLTTLVSGKVISKKQRSSQRNKITTYGKI